MEQKHVLLSALSVGVGLGVGLGLSTGQAVQKWVGGSCESDEISGDQIVLELNNRVIDGKNSEVTFDKFPYYLRYFIYSFIHYQCFHFKMNSSVFAFLIKIILTGQSVFKT